MAICFVCVHRTSAECSHLLTQAPPPWRIPVMDCFLDFASAVFWKDWGLILKELIMIKKMVWLSMMALAAFGNSAYAADGKITVKGNVLDNTCVIQVNNGTNNATVSLPSVSAHSLAAAGDTAGMTPFTISLSACTGANLSSVSTFFEAGGQVDNVTGRLNTVTGAGAATNVQVELLNADFAPIVAGAAVQNDLKVDASSGGGVMHYAARYYALGQVAPGTVDTHVEFTVVYD